MTDKPEATQPEKVTIFLTWIILRPDVRQYKQQSIELVPSDVKIAVDVPREYVRFQDKKDPEKVSLTPLGMLYVQKQIENVYPTKNEDEWANTETPVSAPPDADDGWEAETTNVTTIASAEKSVPTQEEWDDTFDKINNKTPDTEQWDEEKEDWE